MAKVTDVWIQAYVANVQLAGHDRSVNYANNACEAFEKRFPKTITVNLDGKELAKSVMPGPAPAVEKKST